MQLEFGVILFYTIAYFGLFTAIFFLVTLLENKDNIKNPRPKKFPSVCIAVPAYNEENTIAKTIKSLLKLNYPKDKLEIIVIDDGSHDNTYKIASRFRRQGIKVLKKENGGKATALNLALKNTKAEFFASMDADSFVAQNSLKKMIGYFENPIIMAVTPSLKVYKPKNILQIIQFIEYLIGIFLRKIFAFVGSIHVTPGPFTVYRKKFFDKYGKYDVYNLTEDIEIALRIQSKGYEIENSVDANVYTVAPSKFRVLLNQRLRWYIGFTENVIRHSNLFNSKYGNLGLFILPASFISVILVILSLFYAAYILITKIIIQTYLNLNSINFQFWKLINIRFDSFYLNISSLTFISIIALLSGIIMIYIAKRLSKEKTNIKFFYLYHLVIYWILFGFWWTLAGIFMIFGKKVIWGKKADN